MSIVGRHGARRFLVRGRRVVASLVVVLACATSAVLAQEARPALPRIIVEDDGSGSAVRMLEAIDPAADPAADPALPLVAVRLAGTDPGVLAARLAAMEGPRARLWLSLPAPSAASDVESWRTALLSLLEQASAALAVLEITVDRQPPALAAFAVQMASTEARALYGGVRVAIGGAAVEDRARRDELYTRALAPYVDLLSVSSERRREAAEWVALGNVSAGLVLIERGAPASPDPVRSIAAGLLQDLGTPVVSHVWPVRLLTPAVLRALAPLSHVLSRNLTPLDPGSVDLSLRVGGDAVEASEYRLLFDTEAFSTLLGYWGTAAPGPVTVSLRLPVDAEPIVVDLSSGDRVVALEHGHDAATLQTTLVAPLRGSPVLIDFNDGVAIGEESGVVAERELTVEEVIARHQRQQLVQDRLVRTYIADARLRQFFKPTITDPGYEVVTENRYFVADDGIEWEQLSFAVNGSTWTSDPPPFPLLQPEEVFSLPLQLRFDQGYQYRLQGTERVDGVDCHVVRFEPVRSDGSLYRGTVWIDRETFARVRVHAVQGGLPGMVVSSDETYQYAPAAMVGEVPVSLFTGLRGRQTVLISGRNIQIEKSVEFSGFRVNDPDFVEARTSARASDRIMFRETPNGLRYYVKDGDRRVVSDRPTSSVKAMAIGAIVDPSYPFPLPIFGINYIDFSFGSEDQQLALLFGGVLAAGNIQRPQIGSSGLSGSLDFFAIAAPSSDRVYVPEGELEDERVLTWPMSTGLNLGWQATPFQKVSLQYQFRFDAYVRDTTTSESFQPPSSTVTNGIGANWEYSRGGYGVVLNAAWFRRGTWKPWGHEGAGAGRASTPRGYAKYMASVSRDVFIDAFQTVHVDAAWFSGRDLDRFVKYQFGLFDATRIHGVPASARFGELAMARGAYSINIFEQYRLDLFLEHAWGRDDRTDPDWRRIPGIGAAFNLRAPWNTILRADVGKSWLPDRYGSLGSTSLQIMLLKPLR